jgi:hypothetical protein
MSSIDEKQKELSAVNNDFYSNIGSFLLTVTIMFIIIIFYYMCSGLTLYACKLGQSNILPTEMNCSPYKETKPNIQPIESNIFNTFTDPPLSMKIHFPLNAYNTSNKMLDMFLEYKNEPKSNFLANYFIAIMENILHFNYSSLNIILNMLNGLPEVIIILFGPIIISIITALLFLMDHIYLFYLWFAHMGWFFKKNTEEQGKPIWKDISMLHVFDYLTAIFFVILFIILFFFSIPLLSVTSFLAMAWCIFSCITYKSEMHNKSTTSATIIQYVFKYYKLLIMSVFSFFAVASAFSKLGTLPGIFSMLTLMLIYFGIISIDIFKSELKHDLTPLVSYLQAKKTCSYKEPIKYKHGLLYNVLFGQQGGYGGNISKELKNIGKLMSNNK